MKKALTCCLGLGSLFLIGQLSFAACQRLARPDSPRLATFQGQPVLESDLESYYPAYRQKAAAECILASLAAQACGLKKPAQNRSEFYLRDRLAQEWPEARLRFFYSVFKEELSSYEIGTEGRAQSYSVLTLEEEFGRERSMRIRNLPLGSEIPGERGTGRRLLSKRSQFKELEPELLQRIYQSRRAALAYQLLSQASLHVMGPLGNDASVLDFGL